MAAWLPVGLVWHTIGGAVAVGAGWRLAVIAGGWLQLLAVERYSNLHYVTAQLVPVGSPVGSCPVRLIHAGEKAQLYGLAVTVYGSGLVSAGWRLWQLVVTRLYRTVGCCYLLRLVMPSYGYWRFGLGWRLVPVTVSG